MSSGVGLDISIGPFQPQQLCDAIMMCSVF